jgi:hypothetical protein
MKLRPEQTERLIDLLLENYQAKELVRFKAEGDRIRVKLRDIITKNFLQEEEIEQEAREILSSHRHQAGDLDQHRMFLLIKQRLAEKKGFIL